jgi:uncharacterized protein (DUF433 family)
MSGRAYIKETPGINGGYPIVASARTPVRVVVGFYREVGSIEEVLALLPHLRREEVQGALDYYTASPSRVDEDIARNEQTFAEWSG